MAAFEWPWEYSFPPFFTRQPNADTYKKQMDAWCDLVLAYTRHKRIDQLNVDESLSTELFSNAAINRKLSKEDACAVLDELASRGNVEWQDGTKSRCLILWRSPEQWATIIYKWAKDTGHTNTVCTFYELTEGETGDGQEFHGLELPVLKKALLALQRDGKAQMFGGDDGDGDGGVKFFD